MDLAFLGTMSHVLSSVRELATFIGALTVIGGGILWTYQKTIGRAKEHREEERAKQLRDKIEENNKPLLETLSKLDESLDDTLRHRKQLDETTQAIRDVLKKHDEVLDDHHERLIVLEVKGGLRKVGYFKSHGEEDAEEQEREQDREEYLNGQS